MKIIGHSKRKMFDRDNTINLDDAHDAIEKLGSFLKNSAQRRFANKKGTSQNWPIPCIFGGAEERT